MQMFSANELRQIHEERIAPFIQGDNKDGEPKKNPENSRRQSLQKLLKRVTGTV